MLLLMWPNFVKHYLKRTGTGKKEYWYLQDTLRINGRLMPVSIYVGPQDLPEEKLRDAIKLATQKLINKINELHFNEQKRKYTHKILNKFDVEKLESLRFDYSFRFKKLYPSAFEQYKDASYIKYIHGTTAIEGNTFSLAQTKEAIEKEAIIPGKTLREQYEVQNYKKVREFVEETSGRFDIFFIKNLHKLICANIPNSDPGNFRVTPVSIMGMNIETSPAVAVEADVEDLITWYKQQRRNKIHIVELAGIFHQRFEEIHPFIDGNGRVGREIINVMLERADYPPVYFEKADRDRYLDAMEGGNPKNGDPNDKPPIVYLIKDKLFENHEKILAQVKAIDISNADGLRQPKVIQKNLFEFMGDK